MNIFEFITFLLWGWIMPDMILEHRQLKMWREKGEAYIKRHHLLMIVTLHLCMVNGLIRASDALPPYANVTVRVSLLVLCFFYGRWAVQWWIAMYGPPFKAK
jgi:hypothetical protein